MVPAGHRLGEVLYGSGELAATVPPYPFCSDAEAFGQSESIMEFLVGFVSIGKFQTAWSAGQLSYRPQAEIALAA